MTTLIREVVPNFVARGAGTATALLLGPKLTTCLTILLGNRVVCRVPALPIYTRWALNTSPFTWGVLVIYTPPSSALGTSALPYFRL